MFKDCLKSHLFSVSYRLPLLPVVVADSFKAHFCDSLVFFEGRECHCNIKAIISMHSKYCLVTREVDVRKLAMTFELRRVANFRYTYDHMSGSLDLLSRPKPFTVDLSVI